MGLRIEAATEAHLSDCHRVWLANEAIPPGSSPPPENPLYGHVLRTGRLLVARDDAEVVGFAGAIVRSGVWMLTDLFVHPGAHGRGIGRRLLAEVAREAPPRRMTSSSDDVSAMALYARFGMTPRWPAFSVVVPVPAGDRTAVAGSADAVEVDISDLAARDADLCGRDRLVDLRYWRNERGAIGLHLGRHERQVGYAVVLPRTPEAVSDRDAATVESCVAFAATDAADTVAAVVSWAASRRLPSVRMLLPGPHPALVPLLGRRARIVGTDTWCASDDDLLDPMRMVPSPDLN